MKKEVVDGGGVIGSLKDVTATGTCVLVEGHLKKTPEGTQQAGTLIPGLAYCMKQLTFGGPWGLT